MVFTATPHSTHNMDESMNLPGHKLTYPIIEYDDIYLKVYSYPIHILMAEKMNFYDGIEKELEIQIINNLI